MNNAQIVSSSFRTPTSHAPLTSLPSPELVPELVAPDVELDDANHLHAVYKAAAELKALRRNNKAAKLPEPSDTDHTDDLFDVQTFAGSPQPSPTQDLAPHQTEQPPHHTSTTSSVRDDSDSDEHIDNETVLAYLLASANRHHRRAALQGDTTSMQFVLFAREAREKIAEQRRLLARQTKEAAGNKKSGNDADECAAAKRRHSPTRQLSPPRAQSPRPHTATFARQDSFRRNDKSQESHADERYSSDDESLIPRRDPSSPTHTPSKAHFTRQDSIRRSTPADDAGQQQTHSQNSMQRETAPVDDDNASTTSATAEASAAAAAAAAAEAAKAKAKPDAPPAQQQKPKQQPPSDNKHQSNAHPDPAAAAPEAETSAHQSPKLKPSLKKTNYPMPPVNEMLRNDQNWGPKWKYANDPLPSDFFAPPAPSPRGPFVPVGARAPFVPSFATEDDEHASVMPKPRHATANAGASQPAPVGPVHRAPGALLVRDPMEGETLIFPYDFVRVEKGKNETHTTDQSKTDDGTKHENHEKQDNHEKHEKHENHENHQKHENPAPPTSEASHSHAQNAPPPAAAPPAAAKVESTHARTHNAKVPRMQRAFNAARQYIPSVLQWPRRAASASAPAPATAPLSATQTQAESGHENRAEPKPLSAKPVVPQHKRGRTRLTIGEQARAQRQLAQQQKASVMPRWRNAAPLISAAFMGAAVAHHVHNRMTRVEPNQSHEATQVPVIVNESLSSQLKHQSSVDAATHGDDHKSHHKVEKQPMHQQSSVNKHDRSVPQASDAKAPAELQSHFAPIQPVLPRIETAEQHEPPHRHVDAAVQHTTVQQSSHSLQDKQESTKHSNPAAASPPARVDASTHLRHETSNVESNIVKSSKQHALRTGEQFKPAHSDGHQTTSEAAPAHQPKASHTHSKIEHHQPVQQSHSAVHHLNEFTDAQIKQRLARHEPIAPAQQQHYLTPADQNAASDFNKDNTASDEHQHSLQHGTQQASGSPSHHGRAHRRLLLDMSHVAQVTRVPHRGTTRLIHSDLARSTRVLQQQHRTAPRQVKLRFDTEESNNNASHQPEASFEMSVSSTKEKIKSRHQAKPSAAAAAVAKVETQNSHQLANAKGPTWTSQLNRFNPFANRPSASAADGSLPDRVDYTVLIQLWSAPEPKTMLLAAARDCNIHTEAQLESLLRSFDDQRGRGNRQLDQLAHCLNLNYRRGRIVNKPQQHQEPPQFALPQQNNHAPPMNQLPSSQQSVNMRQLLWFA